MGIGTKKDTQNQSNLSHKFNSLSLSLSYKLHLSLKLAKMSSAGNKSLYCPSCKRYVTIVLCESSCSAPHCSLCNWCLCERNSHKAHNPIPKTTTKETETNKAEGTSKSTKKKSPTSKNNVKENDNQTSESQVNTGAVVRSQENLTPQVYHISLESVLESFGLLCTHGDDGASTSTTGRGSEDDYAFTVVWEYDPNLGQRGSHNSKSKK